MVCQIDHFVVLGNGDNVDCALLQLLLHPSYLIASELLALFRIVCALISILFCTVPVFIAFMMSLLFVVLLLLLLQFVCMQTHLDIGFDSDYFV